jgi:hypothetical protein
MTERNRATREIERAMAERTVYKDAVTLGTDQGRTVLPCPACGGPLR